MNTQRIVSAIGKLQEGVVEALKRFETIRSPRAFLTIALQAEVAIAESMPDLESSVAESLQLVSAILRHEFIDLEAAVSRLETGLAGRKQYSPEEAAPLVSQE